MCVHIHALEHAPKPDGTLPPRTMHVIECRWYVWEMPVVVALGLLMGLLGAGWTALNTRLLLARGSYVRHPMLKVSDLLLVCLITNTIR